MTEQKPYAKRQAVALAVAAALLAASGAAAADQVNYDRITESIDSPTTDAVVTYTDQTADTFVTQPPVMPEDRDAQATGMTLTLNLSSRPLVMSTACSRLEPCAPSAA